jgi:hypothetical protein
MKIRALILIGIFLAASSAWAHHSLGATYDSEKEVTLEGRIVQLLLRNPHSFLQVETTDKDGKTERWSLEWRGVGQLGQQGIKRDTLKAGDVVTVTASPSRTAGETRGVLKTLHRKSDGFGWGSRPGEAVD